MVDKRSVDWIAGFITEELDIFEGDAKIERLQDEYKILAAAISQGRGHAATKRIRIRQTEIRKRVAEIRAKGIQQDGEEGGGVRGAGARHRWEVALAGGSAVPRGVQRRPEACAVRAWECNA